MNFRTPTGDAAWWVKTLAALAMLLIWVPFMVSETLNALLWVGGLFLALFFIFVWVFKLIFRA